MAAPRATSAPTASLRTNGFNTVGGDGFFSQVDPPTQHRLRRVAVRQHRALRRKSMEINVIKPQPAGREDLPLELEHAAAISPHSHTRLYCAANKSFAATTARFLAGDQRRPDGQIDRDTWPVMGKFWSADAVAKDVSTSCTASSSPWTNPAAGRLLFAGTDDGLIR